MQQSTQRDKRIHIVEDLNARIGLPRVANLSNALLSEVVLSRLILVIAIATGSFLRVWQINAMGYNTDEAVYSGQAAAIAGVPGLKDVFPIFRAHPLLFQSLLSLIYRIQFSDLAGRLLAAAIGMGTIILVYQLGKFFMAVYQERWLHCLLR